MNYKVIMSNEHLIGFIYGILLANEEKTMFVQAEEPGNILFQLANLNESEYLKITDLGEKIEHQIRFNIKVIQQEDGEEAMVEKGLYIRRNKKDLLVNGEFNVEAINMHTNLTIRHFVRTMIKMLATGKLRTYIGTEHEKTYELSPNSMVTFHLLPISEWNDKITIKTDIFERQK